MATLVTKTPDGFIGWIEPDNSKLIQYIPQGYKNAADAPWQYTIPCNPVYGRNYFLVYPDKFEHVPKNQFNLTTNIPYAFQDAWIKP